MAGCTGKEVSTEAVHLQLPAILPKGCLGKQKAGHREKPMTAKLVVLEDGFPGKLGKGTLEAHLRAS